MRPHRSIRLLALTVLLAGSAASTAHASSVIPSVRCGTDTISPGSVSAADWSADVGTGEQGGVPDGIPDVDTKWTTVTPTAGPAYSITPNSAWVTSPVANWINSRTTSASGGGGIGLPDVSDTIAGATGPLPDIGRAPVLADAAETVDGIGATAVPKVTRFRVMFTLPDVSFHRLIDVDFAADNGVTFFLNGTPIGGYDPPVGANGLPNAQAFNQMHSLVWTGGGFLPGNNVLDAVVTDYGVATGLLVVGEVRACVVRGLPAGTCVRVTKQGVFPYSPRPIDLSTGTQNSESTWTTTAPAAGPAFDIAPNAAWITSPTASWINATGSASTGNDATYAVTFTMNPNATYRDLNLRFAADNGVSFFLNNNLIGGFDPAAETPLAFNQMHTLTWAGAGFQTGTNVLEARVNDFTSASGLVVEGGARICYDDPPTS